MHGTYEANMAMQHCDVLIAIGARFDDRVIGNPKHFSTNPRKIIHIDVDPSSISKRVKVDIPIVGDVREVLIELVAQVEATATRPDPAKLAAWWKQVNEWRKKDCLRYEKNGRRDQAAVRPRETVGSHRRQCVRHVGRRPAPDVGGTVLPVRQAATLDQLGRTWEQWVSDCPMRWVCRWRIPDAEVAVITGEGSIQMCIQELSTCKQYRLTPKIINLNNRYLGMVRQWQQIDYGGRYAESYVDALPDFVKLAEAYGHVGFQIDKPADVEPVLKEAFGKYKDRLVFLDFITDQKENVWPMVKAGKGLTEMLLGSEDL